MPQIINSVISPAGAKSAVNKNPQKKTEEKLKFLKREEINTMQKDIGRLREAEAREERTKITQAKNVDEIKKEKEERQKQEQGEQKQEEQRQREQKQIKEIAPTEIQISPEEIKPEISPKTKKVSAEQGARASKELENLVEEKRKIERGLSWLPEEKNPLEKELKQLQTEIENIQFTELGPTLRDEKKIEEEKKLIEEQERSAGFQERQSIETKRWEIERNRKLIEEKKWQIEAKIEEREQKIKKINLKLAELSNKEKEFSAGIQGLSEKAKGIEFREENAELQEKTAAAGEELKKLETDFQNISAEKANFVKILNEILASEKALEEEISILESKEAKAANLAEQKEIEQKRWETDKTRKDTEEEKWRQQKRGSEIERLYVDIKTELEKKREEKNNLESKIKEIDSFLEKTGLKTPEAEIEPEPAKIIEPEIPVAPIAPPPPPFIFNPEQKIPVPKKEIGQIPPSGIKRILIRSGIVVLLIAILGASLWFFALKNILEPKPTPSPSPSPSLSPSPSPTETAVPPAALISTTDTATIEIKTYAELQNVFLDKVSQLKKDNKDQPTRILIKNTAKNQFLGLKEFLEAFEVNIPIALYDKVDNNSTFFVYFASGEARLGFVAKATNKEGLAELMKTWEKTMEKDFSVFLTKGMAKNQPAISSAFRNAYFKKQIFRYQTFAKNDFGICYGIISAFGNDFLVFTTSGRNMLSIIDLLQSQ